MNWLKALVGLSAVIIAGCAAFFSVTGLGVLFAGASTSVMVMAGSLEFAKLVAATYLKQTWDEIKGFNKWYLTISVGILMIITSAGIFGYLSNAFQQQSLQLQQVDREVAVWQTKIDQNTTQIEQLSTQITEFNTNQGKILDGGTVNSRLIRSIDARDKEISKINDKISKLQEDNAKNTEKINEIKIANIDLEKEIGGFRFVAEAFGIELKNVVKFFIFLIVVVFDPLAISLIIAFNGLVMKRKEEKVPSLYEVYGESPILASKKDAEVFFNEIENPTEPNEQLVNAATQYNEDIKKNEIDSTTTNVEEVAPILTDEELKKKVNESIEDAIIEDITSKGLTQDFNRRGIDIDGDGSIDGYDTNGDGLIDKYSYGSSAIRNKAGKLPYYARPEFDWSDRSKWINDQNAINYWLYHRDKITYPTDFNSKTY
jgi:cell division protein FtsL